MKDWIYTLIVGVVGGGVFVWLFSVSTTPLIPVGFALVYAVFFGLLQNRLMESGFLKK